MFQFSKWEQLSHVYLAPPTGRFGEATYLALTNRALFVVWSQLSD